MVEATRLKTTRRGDAFSLADLPVSLAPGSRHIHARLIPQFLYSEKNVLEHPTMIKNPILRRLCRRQELTKSGPEEPGTVPVT